MKKTMIFMASLLFVILAVALLPLKVAFMAVGGAVAFAGLFSLLYAGTKARLESASDENYELEPRGFEWNPYVG